MSTKLTPTFAVCIAGGLAAGIALARPPQESQAEPVEVAIPQYRDDPAGVDAPVRSEPIEIADFTFNEVAVAAGSVVEVRNSDELAHTVTAVDQFDTGTIDGSSAGTFTAPTQPGTYNFFCLIHPAMQGTLTVQ